MFDLECLGFTLLAKRPPATLHREVVLAMWTTTTDDKFNSIRSLDFVRGWYTTWITGPNTLGCGMHGDAVCALHPGADRDWSYEVVFLHDPCLQVAGEVTPGVLSESAIDPQSTYWMYADQVIDGEPVCDRLDLSRGNCKTKLRHNGVFFPRRKESV